MRLGGRDANKREIERNVQLFINEWLLVHRVTMRILLYPHGPIKLCTHEIQLHSIPLYMWMCSQLRIINIHVNVSTYKP